MSVVQIAAMYCHGCFNRKKNTKEQTKQTDEQTTTIVSVVPPPLGTNISNLAKVLANSSRSASIYAGVAANMACFAARSASLSISQDEHVEYAGY
jgi:hypothetical protein